MSKIQTVLGEINAEELGSTLYHEHLAMKPGPEPEFAVSTFDNTEKIIEELSFFKNAGGGTFVEMSPFNFGRDVCALAEISKATGVHVICCTGFHKKRFLPEWALSANLEEIENILINEITMGIDGTEIKPGVMKIGTSKEKIFSEEEKMIAAVSSVHLKTNIPISTHSDKGLMLLEQCELFEKNQVPPKRVLLGHSDIPNNVDYLKKLCRRGFNVGIDHVGRDLQNKDQVKIEIIKELIQEGYIDQIFIAGDMGKKDYLKVYGGKPGFDYVLTDFKHYFLESGLGEMQFNQILIENPKRFFQSS